MLIELTSSLLFELTSSLLLAKLKIFFFKKKKKKKKILNLVATTRCHVLIIVSFVCVTFLCNMYLHEYLHRNCREVSRGTSPP